MKKFLTTVDLIADELLSLGFELQDDDWKLLNHPLFYCRILDNSPVLSFTVQLSNRYTFSSWANSADFVIHIGNGEEFDLENCIQQAEFIVKSGLINFWLSPTIYIRPWHEKEETDKDNRAYHARTREM